MIYNGDTIYVSPMVETIEIKAQTIICQSTSGDGNESYGDGSTSDWY